MRLIKEMNDYKSSKFIVEYTINKLFEKLGLTKEWEKYKQEHKE